MLNKITLIEPKAPGAHVYSTVNMPRLGLPQLGSVLRSKGYQVKIFFEKSGEIELPALLDSDLVGISIITSTSTEGYRIARFLREKGMPVIIGGPHATFMPEEALNYADYVIRGEGESAILPLLEAIDKGAAPLGIPGVSYILDGEPVHNPPPPCAEDLNSLPSPDLSLFVNMGKLSTVPVLTSRGCPFNCTFCSVTQMFGRKYRFRDPELILEELERYRGRKVFFCDDNFTANTRRTKELLEGMIKRDLLPKWWGAQVRTDVVKDGELLELMWRANWRMAFVGFESINPDTLLAYNKQQDLEDIEMCIEKLHEKRVMVHGMFVFGGDHDTIETIRETVNFALKMKIDTVQFLTLTPLPGTPLFRKLEEEGRLLTRDWHFYDGHHVVFKPQRMTPLELQQETLQAFKKFYSLRHIMNNIFLTGLNSVAFKGVGRYLTSRWDRENRWFPYFLEKISEPLPPARNKRLSFKKQIQAIKLKRLKYLTREELLKISIFELNGVFHINLQGILNAFTLGELKKTLRDNLSESYIDLVINAKNMRFASDEIAQRFIKHLNKLGVKERSVKLVAAFDNRWQKILQRYKKILYFEFST